MKKQPPVLFISIDLIEDEAVESSDPYAVMWAKIQEVADALCISEEEAQQVVMGRIRAAAQ